MKPLFAAGVLGLAWARLEAEAYVVRRVTVPVLPPGASSLKVLHLSDVHMTPRQHRKQNWLRSLASLEPDLVVNTGDNLAHKASVRAIERAYGELLDVPGVFVFGSNDYFSPRLKSPTTYLSGGTGTAAGGSWERPKDLPFEHLRRVFQRRGWVDLNNASAEMSVAGHKLQFAGLDDPHLDYDDLSSIPTADDSVLSLGVAHAPYLRVLDRFTSSGYDLILAGHTHGGQLCLPGVGALVTNCDLDRRRAKGLHRHSADGRETWMHVSAGCGTSPFTPVRFACRPEATLVTLTPQ